MSEPLEHSEEPLFPSANAIKPENKGLSTLVGIGWASGTVGVITMSTSVQSLVLKYSVDTLGITAALAGAIVTATRLFDAALDAPMGSISDRTRSKLGRRRPYLLLGGVLCAIAPIAVFGDPISIASLYPAAYLIVALMFFSIAYTVFNVPHLTMSYEMTEAPQERTFLMSFRVYAFGIGSIVGSSVGPWLVTRFGGGQEGFAAMSWVLSAVILAVCLGSFWSTRFAHLREGPKQVNRPTWRDFTNTIHNRPFVSLVSAKSLYLFGTGTAASSYAFLITEIMGRTLATLGLMLAAMMVCLIIAQPAWVWFSNRWGKRAVYITAAPVNALACLSWLFSGAGEPMWMILVRSGIIGLFGGGMALAIQAMLPDTMQHDYERTGVAQAGVLAGIFTTIERAIAAMGIAGAGLILSLGGYVGNLDGTVVQQSSAITAIYICVAIVPGACILASIGLMWRYNLKG